jgi:serine protease Do
VLRENKELELDVTLGKRPDNNPVVSGSTQDESSSSEKLGLSVQNLTPDVAKRLGFEETEGVIVANVEVGSPAYNAGLKMGDVILEANKTKLKTTRDFEKAVSNLEKEDTLALLVARGKITFYVAIEL